VKRVGEKLTSKDGILNALDNFALKSVNQTPMHLLDIAESKSLEQMKKKNGLTMILPCQI
jgi:hypothetical protein